MGTILGAVSPAVVVPLMIRFIDQKRGTQKGIPTILINGAGIVGNFQDYRGLIELGKDNVLDRVEKEISLGRDESFIENTIEGGLDFTSTEKYVQNIKRLLND